MGLRCLIVDDSPVFLAVASRILSGQGVGVVGVARDSADALTQVDTLRPDVVLVDVGLGTESGFDLARRLVGQRRADGGPVDVILISTHDEQDLEELIAASPATGYLSKTRLSAQSLRDLVAGDRPREA